MWLHKLLGGQHTDDSEPSSVPPHPASGSPVASQARRPTKLPGIRTQAVKKATGFDPYNSGAFRKVSAWERIGKR